MGSILSPYTIILTIVTVKPHCYLKALNGVTMCIEIIATYALYIQKHRGYEYGLDEQVLYMWC